jgi:hypothetical protein
MYIAFVEGIFSFSASASPAAAAAAAAYSGCLSAACAHVHMITGVLLPSVAAAAAGSG